MFKTFDSLLNLNVKEYNDYKTFGRVGLLTSTLDKDRYNGIVTRATIWGLIYGKHKYKTNIRASIIDYVYSINRSSFIRSGGSVL